MKPYIYMKKTKYTYDEVKSILCEGCRLNLGSTNRCGTWYHLINGLEIPCSAHYWRRNANISPPDPVSKTKGVKHD